MDMPAGSGLPGNESEGLLFFRRHLQLPAGHGICVLRRENAVMHVKMRGSAFKRGIRRLLSLGKGAARYDALSSADAKSPFEHNKFRCGPHGTMMQFKKNQKMTRAGRSTAADSFLAVVMFLRWTKDPDWPIWFDTNNIVLSGQFAEEIPKSIVESQRLVNHSSKYPGISLNFEGTRCTPELYTKRSTFIVPGVTTPATLTDCVAQMKKLMDKHRRLDRIQAGGDLAE